MSDTHVDLDDLVLEVRCEKCQGRGGLYSYSRDENEPCPVCDGAGYKPTALGERVLDLMRHNWKPMFRKMMDA